MYLTIDSFHGNKGRPDGLASRCKDCERYWERANPDSHRERMRKSRERRLGKDIERAQVGFRDRLKAFEDAGEYEGPSADDAAERLRRFERGEAYRK